MRRTAELDGLRGLAALVIAAYHLRPQDYSVGWPKVDLFFVLSGYLITTIILRYGGGGPFLGAFFARRVLRIWPAYFLALAGVVAVNRFLPNPPRLDALPHYLTFTQNLPLYWSDRNPAFNLYFLHTWSLAIEEQFYLAWPIVVGMAGRRHLPRVCVGLAAGSVIARLCGYHPWLLIARCDGFAMGGLLAVWLSGEAGPDGRCGLRRGFWAAMVAGLAYLVGGMAVFGADAFTRPAIVWPGASILATNLLYFGLVGLVVCHCGHPALAILRGRAAVALGSISYAIFIVHPLVFAGTALASRRIAPGEPRWLDPIKLVACLLVAALVRLVVERPFLALKDRFPYRPRSRAYRPLSVRTVYERGGNS